MQAKKVAKPSSETKTFGFGIPMRPRRKVPQGGRPNEELIAEFLAKNAVTKCPTRFADGAVHESGYYHF